ncbi:MAG: threonine/serine exporter family protein [Propionibacteriaceae bacterium]|jgi:uncharacterized membrane protein YjjP (DUF1212 family)|nr:threonine/serine exporter family protein [Propionibacteriaceae bacterium]
MEDRLGPLAHHPHVADEENLGAEAHAIVRTGKALLNAGAESHRVRLSMEQVAAAMGIQWLQSQVTLSEVSVTLFKDAQFRTQVGQVHSIGVNADKITRLELMTDQLRPGTTPQAIEALLQEIDDRGSRYSPWFSSLSAALACTAVAFLNNAWWLETVGVLLAAFLGQFLRVFLLRRSINVYLTALLATMLAAFTYIGVSRGLAQLLHDSSPHGAGCVPAVLFIVPGFPLVTAVLDLVKSDITAGVSRIAYAFMILASAAAALVTVTWVFGISPSPLPPPPLPWPWLWLLSALASWLGVAGWAIMFNTRLRGAFIAGGVGLVANLGRLALLELGAPTWAAATLACLMIGLSAHFCVVRQRLAEVTIAVPAALIMIPGAPAFRALVAFSQGDANSLLANSGQAVFTIMGMAIGLSLAKLLTDRDWVFDKRHVLGS